MISTLKQKAISFCCDTWHNDTARSKISYKEKLKTQKPSITSSFVPFSGKIGGVGVSLTKYRNILDLIPLTISNNPMEFSSLTVPWAYNYRTTQSGTKESCLVKIKLESDAAQRISRYSIFKSSPRACFAFS